MLNKIINFSLHNRLLIIVIAVLLSATGIYTASRMEVDVFPDLNAPTVVVMTEAPGMATEEVERTVTFVIETALNGATDVPGAVVVDQRIFGRMGRIRLGYRHLRRPSNRIGKTGHRR